MNEIPRANCEEILNASRLGVLALAQEGESYAIPLYYGYNGEAVYFHCHPGFKDEWIDPAKKACLVVIHVESEQVWESVQVFGPLEKLSLSSDIDEAKNALYNVPFPPGEGNTPSGKPVRTDQDVYYLRLVPESIVGKGSTYKE